VDYPLVGSRIVNVIINDLGLVGPAALVVAVLVIVVVAIAVGWGRRVAQQRLPQSGHVLLDGFQDLLSRRWSSN
jgi:hypothetical protein